MRKKKHTIATKYNLKLLMYLEEKCLQILLNFFSLRSFQFLIFSHMLHLRPIIYDFFYGTKVIIQNTTS